MLSHNFLISDVVWYKNDKLLKNTDNVKIQLKDDEKKTILTIKRATKDDEATYVCKAISEIGLATTKAKIKVKSKFINNLNFSDFIFKLTTENKVIYFDFVAGGPIGFQLEEEEEIIAKIEKIHRQKKPELKKAKEVKERIKPERVIVDKKTVVMEKGVLKKETDEK